MKKLKIRDGQNFQIYIEEKIEQDNFFYHEYEMAVKSLNDIWMEQEKSSDAKELGFSESPNNIIAFCGERGSGKSSVMLSFMKAVIRAGENDDKNMDALQFAQEIRENDWGQELLLIRRCLMKCTILWTLFLHIFIKILMRDMKRIIRELIHMREKKCSNYWQLHIRVYQ